MRKWESRVVESVHEHLEHRLHRLDSFLLQREQRKVVVRVVQHRKNRLKQCRATVVQIRVSHHSSFESVVCHLASWIAASVVAKQ